MSDDLVKRQEEEVRENFKVFQKILPEILDEHEGEFALMRNRKIVGFYDSHDDAFAMGFEKFDDGVFSVQKVTDSPDDLGWFSHAVDRSAL